MAAQQQLITIKAKLEGSDDIRRTTLQKDNLTFSLLQQKLASFFNYQNINGATIKYLDTDGDKITLSSDEELKEALNIIGNDNILRIFLTVSAEKQKQPQHQHQDENKTSDDREDILKMITSVLTQRMNDPELSDQISSTVEAVSRCIPHFVRNCHHFKHIVVGRLLCAFHNMAYNLLDEKDEESLKTAKSLLTAILTIRPMDATATYNLACAESLLGHTDAAIASLAQSINLGFRDVEHIKADTDFDNIRKEEAFVTLVSKLETYQQAFSEASRCGEQARACGRRRCAERYTSQVDVPAESNQTAPDASTTNDDTTSSPNDEPVVVEEKEEIEQDTTNDVQVEEVEDEKVEAENENGVTQSQINKANAFSNAVKSLEAMGFVDMKRNIQALIDSRMDIADAVLKLLNE